jgi:hypothetical protein
MHYKMKMNLWIFFLLVSFFASFSTVQATSPLNGYVTLNNSRFSYLGTLNGAYAANSTIFTIKSSGVAADVNTDNLFPNDVVCLKGATGDGCTNQGTYSVAAVNTGTIFRVGTTVPGTLNDGDNVVSSQSARMTVTFIPRTPVPLNGKVVVTIQGNGSAATNADGIPDIGGFDGGDLTNVNIGANVGSTAGFTYSAIGYSNASGSHVITLTTAAIGVGATCSFTIGSIATPSLRFINPVPVITHVRGVSNTYGVGIKTQDASSNTLDEILVKVVPNDGVMVSANVEMTLSYTISGVSIGTTACGTPASITSTATAVPFDSITAYNVFYNAAQSHLISTNANSGYTLTVQQDSSLTDSLGTGATIPETTCQSSACTSAIPTTWTDALAYKGFGYSLQNKSGNTDEAFVYTSGFKPLTTSPVNILSRTSSSAQSEAYSCYRLAVSAIQPIGYYFNKLTYVATPKF